MVVARIKEKEGIIITCRFYLVTNVSYLLMKFKIIGKWSLTTFLYFFLLSCTPAQMEVKIVLPKDSFGDITMINYSQEDTTKLLEFKVFYSDTIKLSLQLPDSILTRNPLIKYSINTNGKYYESYFAGDTCDILIDLINNKVHYPEKSKFYKISDLSNRFNGDSVQKQLIIEELQSLFNLYPNSVYINSMLYFAFNNNLLSKNELATFNLEMNNNYWIKKLKDDIFKGDSTLFFFNTEFNKLLGSNEYVMLKFWGSWCKPCLVDNKRINELLSENKFKPTILGIQNDSKQKLGPFEYENILDSKRAITNYFKVDTFPHYLLFKNGNLILESNSLKEILDIFDIH